MQDPRTRDEMIRTRVVQVLRESAELRGRLADASLEQIKGAALAVSNALGEGHKVLLFGNGGSAADAQHLAAELVGRFQNERRALPALALTTDSSILTAIGNDYGFAEIFARQVRALGSPGDVAIAISTSGCSENVLAGVSAARECGVRTIGLTGGDGSLLAARCDIGITVPSKNTARIQECHITIGHLICEITDELLFDLHGVVAAILPQDKVLDLDTLLARRERWRAEGKTVVWTNGIFDLLHVGHVRNLQAARQLGSVLVVGINSDESTRRLKGPERPYLPAAERAEMVAALQVVDHVVVFDELTPEVVLSRVKPDIHCKGADYAPPNGKPIPEAELVQAYGGRIEFLPLVPFRSSTDIIRRIRGTGQD